MQAAGAAAHTFPPLVTSGKAGQDELGRLCIPVTCWARMGTSSQLPPTMTSDGSRGPTQSPITKAASHCGPHHPDLSPGSPPPEQPLCTPHTQGKAPGLVWPLFKAVALRAAGTQPCLPARPSRAHSVSHSECCWDHEREPPQAAEDQDSQEPDRTTPPPQLPKQQRQAGEEASVCL